MSLVGSLVSKLGTGIDYVAPGNWSPAADIGGVLSGNNGGLSEAIDSPSANTNYSSGSTGLSGQRSDGTFGAVDPAYSPGSGLTFASTNPLNDSTGDPYASSSASPQYSAEDLAYLDSQQAALDRQLGRTDTTLRDTLDAILQNYNKELTGANTTRGRNLEDFNTKTQISEQGRGRELGKVDTNARMLADSLRQRIGLSSGSGSSAYQIAAPRAVQRQASQQRGDVLSSYGQNFQALDTDKRRAEEDFSSLLSDLEKQRVQREGGARGDIEAQRNDIIQNQGRVAGQRAQLLNGGYNGVRTAMQPYEDKIANGESLIDSIYSKYAAKYDAKPLQVNNTQLQDYSVDKAAIRNNEATGTQDPYSPFRPFNKDEEQQLGY